MTYDSIEVGFVIPNFESTQNVGCPVETYCLSNSIINGDNCVHPFSDLSTSPTVISGNNVFKMTVTGKHQTYSPFYIKAMAKFDT